jgi:hypothetical protein
MSRTMNPPAFWLEQFRAEKTVSPETAILAPLLFEATSTAVDIDTASSLVGR